MDKKLVLVGQGNKLELWAEALWLAEREQALEVLGADLGQRRDLVELVSRDADRFTQADGLLDNTQYAALIG